MEFSALTAVHVANALIAGQGANADGRQPSVIDTDYLTTLGLAERLPAWREAVDEISASPAHCN